MHMYFPVDDLYTVKVNKFFNIDELEITAKLKLVVELKYIWIGELANDYKLGLNIDKVSDNYGKIVINENGIIKTCDYSFEKSVKYSQSNPKQPEIFAAEENDVEFLSQRIKEGWNFNTNYDYQYAVNQAAEYNSHESLLVLLESGATFKYKNYREMNRYDSKTMEILDKYLQNEN